MWVQEVGSQQSWRTGSGRTQVCSELLAVAFIAVSSVIDRLLRWPQAHDRHQWPTFLGVCQQCMSSPFRNSQTSSGLLGLADPAMGLNAKHICLLAWNQDMLVRLRSPTFTEIKMRGASSMLEKNSCGRFKYHVLPVDSKTGNSHV